MRRRNIWTWLLTCLLTAPAVSAQSALQWSGFALLRPQTQSPFLFDDDALSAQLQIGIDWQPTPGFRTHVHVLARNEGDEARRGRAGIVEAFVEKNFITSRDRFRIMAGAFFLPTSRENIDNLWETPFTISSSALNTWLGEEFRPVGVDLTWMRRMQSAGTLTVGATLFGGNDTFGALPIDRGWAIHDRWTLLGEHLPSRSGIYTSVSAETDDRLGWSARGKWNNDRGAFQYTRIDNRSDGRLYGELYNWATRYNIAGGDYTLGQWTVAGEVGWGDTAVVRRSGARRSYPINSSYLLVSRRIDRFRATLRADQYEARDEVRYAYTAALFWDIHPRLRTGIETIASEGEQRYLLEARYRF